MTPTYQKAAFYAVKLFLCLFFILNTSCSNEDLDDALTTEEIDENEGVDENEEVDENENMPNTGELVLESGFILDESKRILNYVLEQSEYDKYLKEEGDFKLISKKVYEHFKDDFDFIFILSNELQVPDGLYSGISYKVQNNIEGIGSGNYNGTSSYGSEGRLKSVIHMPVPGFVVNGPFLHEIVHYWGNHGFIPTTVGGHWGYSSIGGQLGGFDELVDLGNNTYQGKRNGQNGFGTFANGGNSLPYGNIELYIMGLIGPNELDDVQYAENPSSTGFGKFTADNIKTVTAADLIAEHGSRIPSVQNSQKEFTAITVVLSSTKMSAEAIATISTNLENFSRKAAPDGSWGGIYNFWQATQEKASLSIQLFDENMK